MTRTTADTGIATDAAGLEQQIRARIESLSYLPTTMAVAMKFVQLGNNPEAEPSDYAKVIGADSSLSAKLLALANSPWFGIRNKVTTVRSAVNLLGLGTVRTMAISYCMAGLHNELRLTRDESRRFWEACLCKAIAARCWAEKLAPNQAEEAFVAALFEDFAIPVMFAVGREKYMAILADPEINVRSQLQKERELFHLDHTEVGRILAQKLDLPEVFIDAVAFHHNQERLGEFLEHEVVAQAAHAAALFPHMLDAWNRQDAEELCRIIDDRQLPDGATSAVFLQQVQKSVDEYYHYFDESGGMETRLADLLIHTAREGADHTEHLVKTVHQLMQEAANIGLEMNQLIANNTQLMDKASRDQLTGLLNRETFAADADKILAQSARYGIGFALVYFDIDHFKSFNDTHGHQFGDRVLTSIAHCFQEAIREQDLAARVGGDEFVLLLHECGETEALAIVEKILVRVAETSIGRSTDKIRASLSAGLLCVKATNDQVPLQSLIDQADKLMYRSKEAGGNRVNCGVA
jgi:diguanylate cyclase (GGDEF)-like protein